MTSPTGREEPPISVYYEILNLLTSELDRLFSECNTKLAASVCALLPCSETFPDIDLLNPLCELVGKTGTAFSKSLLVREVEVVRSMIAKKLTTTCHLNRSNLGKFLEWFREMEFQVPFPNLHTLLCAALTIGVSSTTCEATFSTVTRLLTLYRRCMGHNRKCELAYLSFEKNRSNALSASKFMQIFKMRNRRLVC